MNQTKLFLSKYEKANEREARKLELGAKDDFAFWSAKTWVKVIFYYCRNPLNESLKRVGRIAPYSKGGRIATRNLTLIPPADWPSSRGENVGTFRYYDCSRTNAIVVGGVSSGLTPLPDMSNPPVQGQWRSFKRDRISIITAYYELDKKEWVAL